VYTASVQLLLLLLLPLLTVTQLRADARRSLPLAQRVDRMSVNTRDEIVEERLATTATGGRRPRR